MEKKVVYVLSYRTLEITECAVGYTDACKFDIFHFNGKNRAYDTRGYILQALYTCGGPLLDDYLVSSDKRLLGYIRAFCKAAINFRVENIENAVKASFLNDFK